MVNCHLTSRQLDIAVILGCLPKGTLIIEAWLLRGAETALGVAIHFGQSLIHVCFQLKIS
jgi:hypothetical protein